MAEEATHELWRNNGQALIVVKKHGEYGVILKEQVQGGRALHITPGDRRLNQEAAAIPEQDVFTNGMLTPVRLLDGAEDAREFAENPNLMTESDMVSLVKGNVRVFEKRLGEITNPVVVKRLMEVAREQDVTIKKLEAVQARLEEVQAVPTIKTESHAPEDGTGPGQPAFKISKQT